jgi:hypothetical protein
MIVSADLHLQLVPPRCRIEGEDGWLGYQDARLRRIVDIANENGEDLYWVGDIFDRAYSPHILISMFIDAMQGLDRSCYIMAGNHDLPNHSWEDVNRSAYGVLSALAQTGTNKIKLIGSSPYNFIPFGKDGYFDNGSGVLFIHRFVVPTKNDVPPGAEAVTAKYLVEEYPEAKLIICGDNHHKFVKTVVDSTVLNCGCCTKRNIDFKDLDLSVWRINEETLDITEIPLHDKSKLVVDSSIVAQQESEGKFMELVSLIKTTGHMTLDYVANLQEKKHILNEPARKILEEIIGN